MSPRRTDETEITARPTRRAEKQLSRPDDDEGLSVEPEDLGAKFLSDATETGDASLRDPPELSITGPASSDSASEGPLDSSGSLWEMTVDLTVEGETADQIAPLVATDPAVGEPEDEPEDTHVTLRKRTIGEISLFDREGDELGEVESPDIDTEESPRHESRGGGRPDRNP